jgi:hypothetical protein
MVVAKLELKIFVQDALKRSGGLTGGLTIMNGETSTSLHHAIARKRVDRCD